MLALNFKASIMGKSKRKVAHSKKEEEQAQRVVKIVFVSLIILALIHHRLRSFAWMETVNVDLSTVNVHADQGSPW